MRLTSDASRARRRFAALAPLAAWALSVVTTGCATSATPAASASTPAGVTDSLPFVEDDYPRALAEAKASHRLLFVDAWAPWCHTCLSMKAYTFRDPKVRAHAGDVVWASVDTERPGNAAWVAAHPMHSWPTLFLVDPEAEKTVIEWPNSATADELVRLLDVARQATHPSEADHGGVLAKADGLSREGSVASAAGKRDDAIRAWREALGVGPDGWPGRAATLESLVDALFATKDYAGCVEAADHEIGRVARGGARTVTLALMCATELPAGDARKQALDRWIGRARAMAVDEDEPMLKDDRSGLYEVIVDADKTDGRDADAKTTAGQWASYLEGEAQKAPDPTAREVFDAHRLDAYLAVGQPERAIPMLEATSRDFPNDYNPPFRLARAYLAMHENTKALAAADRALSLVYGPRTLRVIATKADVLEAQGDRAGAAAALKEGLARVGGDLPARYAGLAQKLLERERALEGAH